MTLQDILRIKGSDVYSIGPDATLADVVKSLMAHRCGSLVVLDSEDGTLLGIITERDILRACADNRAPLAELSVSDYMTTDLIRGTSTDSVEDTMGVMTEHRVRHLPVVDDNRLVGLISIGDVVKSHHHQCVVENHYLKSYIQSA